MAEFMRGSMSTLTPKLANLKDELCAHASRGLDFANPPTPRDRALAAVMVLMAAAAEVAQAAGIYTAYVAWCAAQVPGSGIDEKGRVIT